MEKISLEQLGDKLVENIKKVLRQKGKVASGDLLSSVASTVVVQENQSRLDILMADYATFVDKGRRPGGKMPPVQSLREWVRLKGLPEDSVWGVAKNIQKFGIPATNFISESIAITQQQMQEILGSGYTEQIEKQIAEALIVDATIDIKL